MKDEPVVAFLKFTSCEQFAKDIVSGKLYSNDVKHFRELERQSGIRGQGDLHELIYNIPHAQFKAFDPKTNEVIFESTISSSAKAFHSCDDLVPLICFVGIKESDLIVANDFNDRIEYKLPFTDDELAEMEAKFGKYCVFITPEALIKRLHELNKKFAIRFEPIKYVVENDIKKATAHFEGKIERFFYKDDDLKYQREYRLCIYDEMPDNHVFNVEPFFENEAVWFSSTFIKYARFIQYKQPNN